MFPVLAWAGEAAQGGGTPLSEQMMRLAIQLGVILFAARLGNILFERIKLPGVLGELCAGVLIGPHLLGGIGIPIRGFGEGLFSGAMSAQIPVSAELWGFCSVASVVLLFLVGVETNLKMFTRYSLAGSLVGLGGVAVSFVAGHQFAFWFLRTAAEREEMGLINATCIFFGVISTATSVGITARVLSDKKKLDTPEGVTILAGAVIDDVLGVMMLALGLGVAGGLGSEMAAGGDVKSWAGAGRIVLQLMGIWAVALVAGILLTRWVSVWLKKFSGAQMQTGVMALGFALVMSGLFEEAGLTKIIGAYVMGLSFSRTDISRVVQESLKPVFTFLVPVFFVVMGMMVDVHVLLAPGILVMGVLFTVEALAAKLVGCGLPVLLCGFTPRGALRVGLGMMPRGEMALIVAGTGYAAGYLKPSEFGVAVFMAFMTSLIAPPLLVASLASPKPGHKSRREEEHAPEMSYDFPAPEIAGLVLRRFLDTMRREGFFIHTLDEHVYQLRKDAKVIGVSGRDTSHIVFECDATLFPFVQTAMREVMVEMDQTLTVLRKPFSSRDITSTLSAEPEAHADERMLRFVHRGTLVPELKGAVKSEVIAELVNVIAAAGLIDDPVEVTGEVLAREAGMATGIGHGLAVPHARTHHVKQLVCAIGISRRGVDFGADDGEPVYIVSLVLCPDDSVVPYMEYMASLQGAFDDEGRTALLNADSADAMYAALATMQRVHKK